MTEEVLLLAIVRNLAEYHREHEKYYSEVPLADAISLQRTSRTLMALSERWRTATPVESPVPSPFAGAVDLNDERAIETGGVLFMEGEGEPAEIARIKSELENAAATCEQTGSWLSAAMESAWGVAEALLAYPALADLLGERHRIIGNDWQAASMALLNAHYLRRAVAILERVDFAPAALRADLANERVARVLPLLGRRADREGGRSVRCKRGSRPRKRAALACVPPARRADRPHRVIVAAAAAGLQDTPAGASVRPGAPGAAT